MLFYFTLHISRPISVGVLHRYIKFIYFYLFTYPILLIVHETGHYLYANFIGGKPEFGYNYQGVYVKHNYENITIKQTCYFASCGILIELIAILIFLFIIRHEPIVYFEAMLLITCSIAGSSFDIKKIIIPCCMILRKMPDMRVIDYNNLRRLEQIRNGYV